MPVFQIFRFVRIKMLYNNELITQIVQLEEIIIYGAGVMGQALMTCLKDVPYNLKITCFIVEDPENNPKEISGVPVIGLKDAIPYKEKTILVALHEKYMENVTQKLYEVGFLNLLPISFDSDIWSYIRGNWYYEYQKKNNLSYFDLNQELTNEFHVYVVHNIADKPLKEKMPFRNYEIPIQVGAALTDTEMFPVRDNLGENISNKNHQYCELTALYWIWRHDKSKFAGLSHYRRRFQIEENQVERLSASDIDVIVTIPVLNFAGVRQQYSSDHEKEDWDIMVDAIKKLHPEYLTAVDKMQNGIFYYAYNMFIARREVLDDYCSWLFPILFYCEKRIGIKTDSYQNRYIGFLAERLFTVYLIHNTQFKVAIAQKHFFQT